jgi:hypothetical protein
LLQRVAKPVSIASAPAGRGDAVDPAAAVVDQRLAVAQPVGRLDPGGRDVDDPAVGRGDRLRLEGAVQVGFPSGRGSGVVSSTFEKTAFSVTSLLCAQTPMPT